ncbi:hypothetical protein BIW11_05452 [Tropilaelaps mercedesae]|uniref:Uncharacterized protein n=1 Tax=Tropilaelaps mercedesae TaxID=418985 RepID=A0A1V9Y2D0_9ACAR|nr:hypothetical protein BIW11_05452 [Tropilaelaps mercedesae]
MYPAVPEMDLSKNFEYKPETLCPILVKGRNTGKDSQTSSGDTPPVFLHTLFITHPWNNDGWKPSEKLGRAILQSFTFAAAQTIGQVDKKVYTLPVPNRLRLQTVYHDLENVGFIVYHLNTLAPGLSGDPEGPVRNELYHECFPLQEHDELNPRVLKWLKVFYET